MSDFSLDEWFVMAKRGTSGDQVYDILYAWKAQNTRNKEICVRLMEFLEVHGKNLLAHKDFSSLLQELFKSIE
jgi:hypothetical protein